MKSSILFSVAAASTAYAAVVLDSRQASNWTVGQTVNTTSGSVAGHAALNQTGVSEYLGIPFAQPPVADLRFEAPVKYTGNTALSGLSYVGCTGTNLILPLIATFRDRLVRLRAQPASSPQRLWRLRMLLRLE
jgi:hypothetical protein